MQTKEILRSHYVNLLCKMINEKGADRKTEARTIEDIFDNLPLLATKIMTFGEESMYLSLNVKKMIAKAMDPEVRIVYAVTERTKTELAVEAFLYWGGESEYTGYGYCKKSLESLVNDSYSAGKVETNFEALVKGAAASRALTDAGIGLEFYCDECDELLLSMENNEVIELAERKEEKSQDDFEKKVPDVPSLEELKKKRMVSAREKEKKEDSSPTLKEKPATEEPPVNEAVETARKAICDVGDFKGQTLGEIFDINPRLLVKIVRDESSTVREEARTLVLEDGTYSQYV